MKAIQVVFEFLPDKEPDELVFVPLGDFHIGAIGTDEAHAKKYIDWIRRKKAYWWLMGDAIDAINYHDPRFNPQEVAEWMKVKDLRNLPLKQADHFLDLVAPIANRCLFAIHGNHEEAVAKYATVDIPHYIANALGVPYLGYSGLVQLRFRGHTNTHGNASKNTGRLLFVHHGWGGGRKPGGKANKLMDLLVGFAADDYFMGHVHDVLCSKQTRVGIRSRKRGPKSGEQQVHEIKPGMSVYWMPADLRSEDHCFALTGSFLKQAIYSEIKGYNPSFIGAIKYTVQPFVWRTIVSGKGTGRNHGDWTAVADVGTFTL